MINKIVTSTLVISGFLGSVHAGPVAPESYDHHNSSVFGSQVLIQKEIDAAENLSNSILGVKSVTLVTTEQPKIARRNSFEHLKEAKILMSEEAKVTVQPRWYQRVWSWVKGCFGF